MTRVELADRSGDGCTFPGCGSAETIWLTAYTGRRCAAHPPVFDPDAAVSMACTDPAAAGAYLRTPMPGDLP